MDEKPNPTKVLADNVRALKATYDKLIQLLVSALSPDTPQEARDDLRRTFTQQGKETKQ